MLSKAMALAGALSLALAGVAWGERVTLTTGEILRGRIVGRDEKAIALEHPVLGRLVIRRADIAAIAPDADPSPAAPPAAASSAAAPSASDAPATPVAPAPTTMPARHPTDASAVVPSVGLGVDGASALPPAVKPVLDPERWKTRLTIGVGGARDVNESLGGNIGIKAKRVTRRDRWTLESAFFYSQTNSIVSRNEVTGATLKDWLIPDSRWFIFAEGAAVSAQFRPYDVRLSGAAGPGYQIVRTDSMDLRLRLGGGGYQEMGSSEDGFHPESSLGVELDWRLSKRMALAITNTFFADVGDIGRNRNITNADWTLRLEEFPGLSLKVSIKNEYDSITSDDAPQNDLRFSSGLQFEF